MEDLTGRYIKCIYDKPISHYPCHNGDYLKYVGTKDNLQYWGDYDENFEKITYQGPNYFGTEHDIKLYFKLMPIGFDPLDNRIEEAKRKYPKGTIFKSAAKNNEYVSGGNAIAWISSEYPDGIGNDPGQGMFYANGKWAEIVSFPKEIIPEYVECIKQLTAFSKGKIYKTEAYGFGNYRVLCPDGGGQTIKGYEDAFKPSTKEAFDVQNDTQNIAVHCTTQEEWDFVISKFNPRNIKSKNFETYNKQSCINYKDEEKDNIGLFGCVDFYLENNYKILSFQEWCNLNGYKMETKLNFKVGKWYEYNGWYLKLKEIKKDLFVASEYIDRDKSYRNNLTNFTCGKADDEKVLLFDLSEIQQYLPYNHPDKKLNLQFEVGKWYKNLGHDKEYIGKFLEMKGCCWYCSEYFYNYKYYPNETNLTTNFSNSVECPLNEMQQYLPDGHPDKLKTEQAFEVGKWYEIQTSYRWIIKFESLINGTLKASWKKSPDDFSNYKYVTEHGMWKVKTDFKPIKQLSIYEVQQYLPDGHPDKIKSNQEFRIGDWCIWMAGDRADIFKIHDIHNFNRMIQGDNGNHYDKDIIRHATPEEINNHLISIVQIPNLPDGHPDKINKNTDYMDALSFAIHKSFYPYEYQRGIIPTTGNCYNKDFATSYIPIKPKMILSIDDEELPMVGIVKTKIPKKLNID